MVERWELNALVKVFEQGFQEMFWGLVLFGSVARGEATETSDLDLLVVADALPERFADRMRLLRRLLPSPLRGRASLLAKTRIEFEGGFPSYYLDLALDGITLYDREGYMKKKLERIRSLIQAAGLARRQTEYGFFWRNRSAPPPAPSPIKGEGRAQGGFPSRGRERSQGLLVTCWKRGLLLAGGAPPTLPPPLAGGGKGGGG